MAPHIRLGPQADYYTVLGAARTATDAELRRAYRDQALKHHPDKNPENVAEATEKFKLVAEAYSVLKDPKTRAVYDQDGSAVGDASFNFEKASDLFSDVFGAELAGTLGRAARGLVSAPGIVLGSAAQFCSDLPGVRGAVAAGYESMVADAEFVMDLEVRRLATLDEHLDAAWCRIRDNEEEAKSSRQRRDAEEDREKKEVWSLSKPALTAFIMCAGIRQIEMLRPLLALLLPCFGYAAYHLVISLLSWRRLLQRHAEHEAAETRKRSELQHALHDAQEIFEAQRRMVTEAQQELRRLSGKATDAEQHGPSLSHAFAVSSHVVGNVVGSVFGRRRNGEDLNAAGEPRRLS